MNVNQFMLLSSMLGDELYRDKGKPSTAASSSIEKQFRLLANKPIAAYLTSGLPAFWPARKIVPRFF